MSENAVELVPLSVEDLSPRPKRSRRSDPELVVVALGLLILLTLETVGVAETELFVVGSWKSLLKPDPSSPRGPSLFVLDALVDESEMVVALGLVKDGELVVESPPKIPLKPDSTPSRKLSLGVGVEDGVVGALTDLSTTDPSLLVVPASTEAASEFFWVVFSVLEPSVFWVVVVVVAVGSPPMVVVPVMR